MVICQPCHTVPCHSYIICKSNNCICRYNNAFYRGLVVSTECSIWRCNVHFFGWEQKSDVFPEWHFWNNTRNSPNGSSPSLPFSCSTMVSDQEFNYNMQYDLLGGPNLDTVYKQQKCTNLRIGNRYGIQRLSIQWGEILRGNRHRGCNQ